MDDLSKRLLAQEFTDGMPLEVRHVWRRFALQIAILERVAERTDRTFFSGIKLLGGIFTSIENLPLFKSLGCPSEFGPHVARVTQELAACAKVSRSQQTFEYVIENIASHVRALILLHNVNCDLATI